ncbi:hypothetical protein GKZ28_14685 [Clostridium chromiireducens]|uniref:Uncharacterized protein n=1 Tax=Clostridium chromiireducens TaxID=225345 RepID=A0A964RNN2_9CLOT|nr:hypothetical protein [Clostridium chromiireducens]MVX64939.1 hypothetical protein [Clostridium chromiireducens]
MEDGTIQQLLDHIAAGGANYFNVIGNDGYYNPPIEETKISGSIITIYFVNGMLDIYDTDTITKARRPENRINKCEWCYKIKSEEGQLKGWILKDVEVKKDEFKVI